MSEQKLAQFYPNVAQIVYTVFYLNCDVFQNSPKGHHIFGLLLCDNLSPRTLKIAQSGHTGTLVRPLLCESTPNGDLNAPELNLFQKMSFLG